MQKNNRLRIIQNVLILAFFVIFCKIIYMTTFRYDYYAELAENKTYKHLTIKAPRGEIRDRYGRLLAGNKNSFTVQVSGDGIKKEDSNGNSMANEVSLKLINILEKNKEEYVDEFPIYIKDGKFFYTFDDNINEFKKENQIPSELDAKESFYFIVDREIANGVLSEEDRNLDKVKLQAKLNENQIYPPILVSNWMFTDEKNKQDWLKSYNIDNMNISAKDAFNEIRSYKSYLIDKSLSNEDARKILIVRDIIKSQGYSQYNPVTIAKDIDEKTISQIEEQAMELPGVNVAVEPTRYYPNGSLAFHILGQVGKIPYMDEEKYLSGQKVDEYIKSHNIVDESIKDKKYIKGDLVGKSGIEQSYEVALKGIDGYKRVQVDALGRITKELDVVEPKSGDTVYLSIDKNLQEYTEKALKNVLATVRTGGVYESPYGNYTISTAEPNAQTGAVIAVDVKTGDVLSMASYPTFDPNKFVTGLSDEDYKALKPSNANDVLAPSAEINLATQGVFQPGSTFKMITGMAALEKGMDPNYTIQDPGVIMLGNRPFADYIWHKVRGNHGATNLYKAIQESCNIYFYTLGSGTNFTGGEDPNPKIGIEDIFNTSKLFGLDEKTGLYDEIYERNGRVPSIDDKKNGMKALLRSYIDKTMANDFEGITRENNKEEYDEKIDTIVSWVDEEEIPTRGEVIKRLEKLGVKEDRVEKIADSILFDYLKFSKWSTADAFNISIGQGENQATPAQIVRYISAIANGGNLVELSTVDRVISSDYSSLYIDENQINKIKFNNLENLKILKDAMELVVTQGSAKKAFANFPIKVAAKTGTADKSGKIPTDNEVNYLETHIQDFGVSLEEARDLAAKLKKEKEEELKKEREEEIKKSLNDNSLSKEEKESLEKELKEGVQVKLEDNDKVNSSYLRKAIKELNPNLTDEKIDQYKSDYRAFSWSVAFAPSDNPEIAVAVVIPQGGSSGNAMLMVREVMGAYFEPEKINTTDSSIGISNEDSINFVSSMKK